MEVAASIIAILQISGKVIGYIQTASGSKTDRNRLRDAVRECSDILQELRDNADNSEAGKAWIERIRILDQPGGPLHRLRTTLSQVQTRLQSDGLASKLRWPFQEKDMMKLVGAIESEKNLLQLALTNNNGRLLHEVNAKTRENTKQLVELTRMLQLHADASQDISLKLDNLGVSQSSLHSGMEALQNRDEVREDAKERKETLAWLSKADHGSSSQDAIQKRHETTCTWFLDSPEYILWKHTKGKTLFCPGMPGAGKTILASVVINDLCESYKSESSYGIAFLFNIFNEHQSSKELLASLLQQLAKGREHLPASIKDLYKRHTKDNDQKPISSRDIIESVRTVASSLQHVYLVVDALDECNMNSRREFLSAIFTLRDKCDINILATSRDIPDITSQFKEADVLEIRAKDEDIQHFVRAKSHQLSKVVHDDATLLEETAIKIAQLAQGMFLLAQLHVDSLAFKRSKKQFRDGLQKLASGSGAYDHAYKAALKRIDGQTEEQAQFAKEALTWVVCAKRPMSTSELREALAVEDGVFDFDPENRPCSEDILSACAGLLVVDEVTERIRLVHYTAQEFFDRNRHDCFPTAELMLARTCITYLSLSVFSEPQPDYYLRRRLKENQLFSDYAAKHWAVHAGSIDTSQTESAILNLLNQHELVRNVLEELTENSVYGATGLHLAIWSGFYDAVALLLRHGFDSNAALRIHHQDQTPLGIAASRGHTSIAKLLISNGAKIDTECTSRLCISGPMSPIETASAKGHEDIVKLLIDGSAIRDLQSSLYSAIEKCSVSLCEMLLERASVGPEIISKLLKAAISCGRIDSVVFLLRKHCTKNTRFGDGRTSLFYAAFCGSAHTVRHLLNASATVDISDNNNQTPLYVAVCNRHTEVVRLLLHGGADTEFRDSNGLTMLQLAVSNCQEDTVKLLLDSGARFDISDACGRTLLHLAAGRGNVSIVECIFRTRISPNVQDDQGQTPLHTAASRGRIKIVQCMLSKGAEIDFQDNKGQAPLHTAASRGRIKVVQCMLNKGAEINVQDEAGCTAFWHACTNEYRGVAETLLKSGANWQISDHAGVGVRAFVMGKDWHRCREMFVRFEKKEAILKLMEKRRAEKALLASETQSHVEAEEEIA